MLRATRFHREERCSDGDIHPTHPRETIPRWGQFESGQLASQVVGMARAARRRTAVVARGNSMSRDARLLAARRLAVRSLWPHW